MALSFKQLCQLLDCKQAAKLKRVLKQRGIHWSLDGNGKPWTTEAQLDKAISPENRVLTFTRPPCPKKNSRRQPRSRQACAKSTAPGTTSESTNGQSYVE
jgi:hypothetical protein